MIQLYCTIYLYMHNIIKWLFVTFHAWPYILSMWYSNHPEFRSRFSVQCSRTWRWPGPRGLAFASEGYSTDSFGDAQARLRAVRKNHEFSQLQKYYWIWAKRPLTRLPSSFGAILSSKRRLSIAHPSVQELCGRLQRPMGHSRLGDSIANISQAKQRCFISQTVDMRGDGYLGYLYFILTTFAYLCLLSPSGNRELVEAPSPIFCGDGSAFCCWHMYGQFGL